VLGHWSLFPHQFDSWFGDPGGFALGTFRRFTEFVVAELEPAFFAGGYFDYRLILHVLEGLQEMLQIFDGVFTGLIGETGDLGDGHGAVEKHGD
jgi:hypothetical protein